MQISTEPQYVSAIILNLVHTAMCHFGAMPGHASAIVLKILLASEGIGPAVAVMRLSDGLVRPKHALVRETEWNGRASATVFSSAKQFCSFMKVLLRPPQPEVTHNIESLLALSGRDWPSPDCDDILLPEKTSAGANPLSRSIRSASPCGGSCGDYIFRRG